MRRLALWLGFLVVLVSAAGVLAQVRLPDPEQVLTDPGSEKLAGYLFSQRFEKGFEGVKPKILPSNAADAVLVQKVTDRLAAVISYDRPNMVFAAKVVEDPEVNAFCIPGGYIYVYTGLLDHLRKNNPGMVEDSLAVVMGHEIAHAVLRHSLQNWAQEKDYKDVLKDRDSFERLLLATSRTQEFEADRYGALYAVRAGYRFSAAVDLFEKFPKTRTLQRYLPSDHPSNEARVKQMQRYGEQLKSIVALWDDSQQALHAQNPEQAKVALEILKSEFPNLPSVHNNLGWVSLQLYEKAQPSDQRSRQQMAYSYMPELGISVRDVHLGPEPPPVDVKYAQNEFRQALDVNPGLVSSMAGSAVCALLLHDEARAEAWVQQGLRLSPDDPALNNALGVLREHQGNRQGALDAYQAAVAHSAGFAPSLYNLALLDPTSDRLARYLAVDSSGWWADQIRARLQAAGANTPANAAPEAASRLSGAAGVDLGASSSQLQAALGTPTESVRIDDTTTVLRYPTRGVAVTVTAPNGVVRIRLQAPSDDAVAGLHIGSAAPDVEGALGRPVAVSHADGVEYWSYPARSMALGVKNGRVVSVDVGP